MCFIREKSFYLGSATNSLLPDLLQALSYVSNSDKTHISRNAFYLLRALFVYRTSRHTLAPCPIGAPRAI
jgi:hypothetical protein